MAEKFDLFGLLLGASFAAGIAVLVVAAARLILKKAPKRWSYIMWAVVFFRCLCPFSAESSVSIFNALNFAGAALTSETAEADRTVENPVVNVSEPAPVTDGGYVPSAPSETFQPPASEEYIVNTESIRSDSYEPVSNDIQNVYNAKDIQNVDEKQSKYTEQPEAADGKNGTDSRTIFTIVWLCGVGAMALYGIVSAARLAARVKTAVRTEKGIYESDRISTAFAAGLLRPKIYIPCGIPEDERRLIVMHERVHIRRRDYLFKLLAFAGLSLHWFNPLIWAAFALMTRDMEMSCDEAVLRECGESGRILYAEALVRVSVKGFGGAAVVGFGETGIKKRVKNVLNYKKPGKFAAIAAAVVMLASCTMAGTDAVTDKADSTDSAGTSTAETAMEICGQQFSFPFKADDLPDGFKLDETGHYIEATGDTGFMMYYNGEEIAYVYCVGKCENSSEAVITSIGFGMFTPVPEINIMGIKGSSSSDEVKQILGEPNYIQDNGNAYKYIFSNEKQLLINFTDDEKSIECLIVSYAEKTVEPETDTVDFDITHEITGWTMEDLVNDVYLGGHKIVLPAHSNSLDPAFSLSGLYDKLLDSTVFTLSCNNEEVAYIVIDGDHSNDSDIVIDHIMFGFNMPMPELNIMGITESSSSDEVKRILGEPNYILDDGNTYRYIFSDKKQFRVSFTDDEEAIDFYCIKYGTDDMADGELLGQNQRGSETSSDIAVSREYEFDAEKYIDGLIYKDQWQLRNELDFLSDEQYDVFIRAWLFIDMIEPLNEISIRSTSETPAHFLDKNGEVCASYYDREKNEYAQYEYVSTYQSFYKYLQSVFTQDAVDKIMSDKRFLTVGDELYFSFGEAGGAIDFKGGEYRLVEKNDDEVAFEYVARHSTGKEEWTVTHPIRLVRTADGWHSELFEHLRCERRPEVYEQLRGERLAEQNEELRLQEELRRLQEEEERLKKEAELRRQSEEAANTEKFSYPFSQFPVSAADLGEYGANEWHVLFAVPKGTAVLAAEDGTVKSAKRDFNIGYGLCMEISHDDEMSTFYAHLDEFAVKVGDKVKKGDVIAYSGSSGYTKGDALLFEIRKDGIYEDPRDYYSFSEDGYRRSLEEIGKDYEGGGIQGIYYEDGNPVYENEQETIKVGDVVYYLISTEEQLRAIAA
ncbi:MAG: peptidoglycan DD-metalloendopeptidase family protein, partial [Oscillospiraceae bacterium]|nr:peptidoglycan DD-metalloendopeptidase family protein [Oscillospiraceae bacterium]